MRVRVCVCGGVCLPACLVSGLGSQPHGLTKPVSYTDRFHNYRNIFKLCPFWNPHQCLSLGYPGPMEVAGSQAPKLLALCAKLLLQRENEDTRPVELLPVS